MLSEPVSSELVIPQLENKTLTVLNFTTSSSLRVIEGQEFAETNITTFNPEVFLKLYSETDQTDWLVGVRSLAIVANLTLG